MIKIKPQMSTIRLFIYLVDWFKDPKCENVDGIHEGENEEITRQK